MNVRLNIPEIPEEGLDQELDLPVELNNGLTSDLAHVVLRIIRVKKMVLIEGTINIDASLTCSRCCGDFVQSLKNITFKEEYNPAEEIIQEDEQELTDQDMELNYYNNDEIDLKELIKEQVLISVPMKPLCSENCKGICAGCGKELNAGPCECNEDILDPRLAPLQQLKEAMKNRKPSA